MNKRRRFKAKKRRRTRDTVADLLNGLHVPGVRGIRAPMDWRYVMPPRWCGLDLATGPDWTVER